VKYIFNFNLNLDVLCVHVGPTMHAKLKKFKLVDYYSIISKKRTSFDWHKLSRGENRFNVGQF
jgi:hypothetical protein